VLEDQVNEVVAIDQPEVALAAGEGGRPRLHGILRAPVQEVTAQVMELQDDVTAVH